MYIATCFGLFSLSYEIFPPKIQLYVCIGGGNSKWGGGGEPLVLYESGCNIIVGGGTAPRSPSSAYAMYQSLMLSAADLRTHMYTHTQKNNF